MKRLFLQKLSGLVVHSTVSAIGTNVTVFKHLNKQFIRMFEELSRNKHRYKIARTPRIWGKRRHHVLSPMG